MLALMETLDSLDAAALERLADGLFEPFWGRISAEEVAGRPGLNLVRWQRRLPPSEWLNAEERERLARFRNEEAALLYGQGRSALRFCGARLAGCPPLELEIDREANGKPFFATAGLPAFNKSHSHGQLAIGFNDAGPIGIDLECRIRPTSPDRLATRYFHPTESDALAGCDPSVRHVAFLVLWVCKEAALKLSGEGLAGGLEDARVVEISPERALVVRGRSRELVAIQLFQFGNFLGAIATHGGFPVANWVIAD